MPQIDWKPEFKRTTSLEFDRLKLKVGEKARIILLELPTFTWVHTLRAPKIVDGRANKVIKRRKDGTEYADWDMDFIGRPQCLGDHATIAEDAVDPKNCPICARAQESDEVDAPERRFAINVIRYNTKADGTLTVPFSCTCVVWTFTENNYNKLTDIAQENGNLVGRDLILGPCQAPEAFQKFDIATGARNYWQESEEQKQTVLQTHKNNRIEDLEAACGRRVEAKWLRDDIEKIKGRWRIAHGETAAPVGSEKQEIANLKGELDNLLAPAPDKPALHTRIDHSEATDRSGPVTDEEKRESAGESDPTDFSKLLADLNL
jgi:hypothetical protein